MCCIFLGYKYSSTLLALVLMLLDVRVAQVEIGLHEVAHALLEDLEFGESALGLGVSANRGYGAMGR